MTSVGRTILFIDFSDYIIIKDKPILFLALNPVKVTWTQVLVGNKGLKIIILRQVRSHGI